MDQIKILHLEDNSEDAELILSALEMGGLQVDYTRVDKEHLFLEQLSNNRFDIVLADYHLPSYDGAAALKVCSRLYPDMPFIIVSGTLGEEIAVEMLKYGASDYLLKQNLKRLAPAIEQALARAQMKKQKQNAEDNLRKSEEKYRKIFENVQDVFFQVDMEGTILEISPSIFRMLGCPQSILIGEKIAVFFDNPEEYSKMLDLVGKEGEIWDFEIQFKNRHGNTKYVSINAHQLSGNDTFVGIEGSIRDIDARKQAETELIKAKERAEESDRLKSAFLANISHEIRTPMNGILGFASLLREPVLTGDQQQMYVGIIEESGKRMLNLINQLVDISKLNPGK
jgi:PAS domain S-box-containing protein